MTEEVTNEQATDAVPVQLGLNDIAAFANIIDICSKRGAFEGGELETVGALRNRVVAFLQSVAPAEEAAEAPAEGEDPSVDEAADA